MHEPNLTAPIRRPRFRLFLAGCLCILGLLAPAASGQSLHSGLTLAPDVINLELAPGESLNYRVALRSGVNLSRVTLWVPPGVDGCRVVTGRIVYVERVDPDGDGDLHVVVADAGISLPGLTSVDVRPGLRPRRDPRVGDRASAAGPVQQGSFGQAQIHALRFRVGR